jgi:hypothetical protein
VVIYYLNVVRLPIFPAKTQAPLVVNSNTVLSYPAPSECLKPTSGWNSQILKPIRRLQHRQFLERSLGNVYPAARLSFDPELLGISAPERRNHVPALYRTAIRVSMPDTDPAGIVSRIVSGVALITLALLILTNDARRLRVG